MFRRKLASEKAEKIRKFNKKHLWWIIPLLGVFCLVVVQFFWPESRARPFYGFGGENIFLISKDEFAEKVQGDFLNSKVVFEFSGEKFEIEFSKIGARPESHNLTESIFAYPMNEKIIPFSIFKPQNVGEFELVFDETLLEDFLNKYISQREKKPENASISIDQNGEIVVKNDVDGLKILKEELKNSIKSSKKVVGENLKIEVSSEKVLAEKKSAGYLKVKGLVEAKLSKSFSLSSEQKIYTPSRKEIASWISFDEKDGEIKLAINDENLQKYVNSINRELEIPAEKTVVEIVDGREKSRTPGKNGQRISFEKLKQSLEKYFDGEIFYPNFILAYEEVLPSEHKNYSYTNTQEGLQAKVNEIGSRYDVRISLKQLNGAGWEANYRENESTPSASTYKLYVAMKLFDEMNKGSVNWNSGILGTNTKDCFYQMIVVSTNRCAEEWIRMFGRTNLNNFLYGIGFSKTTTFTAYDAARTNVKDLRNAVEGIYGGRLASGENREILLHFMDIQKYPYGIPKGSNGRVFDKVGFLWDYVHDTGIVEHPRGTYAVAIMTKNSGGYATIAQITRELEAFMYP